MKILAISTAEKESSIALLKDENPLYEAVWASKQTHSKRIMDMIALALNRASLKVDDLDGFVVAKGPGSFTGLRIGIASVKGLAFAASKPCAGVSSLDGIAWQFSFVSMPLCVMMDAQRGEVYSAVYNFDHGRLVNKSEEKALSPIEALGLLKEETLFAGSGSVVYKELIKTELSKPELNIKANFAPMFQNKVKASALVQQILQNPCLMTQKDPLTPEYLRKSDAQINKKQTLTNV